MIQFFKNFSKYTKRVYFTKAFDLQSRASRKEHSYALWIFTLMVPLLTLMWMWIGVGMMFGNFGALFIGVPVSLPILFGILSVSVRRLNDCNIPLILSFMIVTGTVTALTLTIIAICFRNSSIVVLAPIFIILFLLLLHYLTRPSTPGENKYGPQPVEEYSKQSAVELTKTIQALENQMLDHAKDLDFEKAAELRDKIAEIQVLFIK